MYVYRKLNGCYVKECVSNTAMLRLFYSGFWSLRWRPAQHSVQTAFYFGVFHVWKSMLIIQKADV